MSPTRSLQLLLLTVLILLHPVSPQEMKCSKLIRGRNNPFKGQGLGRTVTFNSRKNGVGAELQHLGSVFFTSTFGEPIYGVELDLSNKDSSRSILVLQFKSVVRQSTAPCNNWPAGMKCAGTKPGPGSLDQTCVTRFTVDPYFQDLQFTEEGDLFLMSINGEPLAWVERPQASCLLKGITEVGQIFYRGTGATHLYSCM